MKWFGFHAIVIILLASGPCRGQIGVARCKGGRIYIPTAQSNQMAVFTLETLAGEAWDGMATVQSVKVLLEDGNYVVQFEVLGGDELVGRLAKRFTGLLEAARARNPELYSKYFTLEPLPDTGAQQFSDNLKKFQSESTVPKSVGLTTPKVIQIPKPNLDEKPLTPQDQAERSAMIAEEKRKWNDAQRNSTDKTKKEFGKAVDRYNGQDGITTGYRPASQRVTERNTGLNVPDSRSVRPTLGPDGKIRPASEQHAMDDNEWLKTIQSPHANYTKPTPSNSSASDEAMFPLPANPAPASATTPTAPPSSQPAQAPATGK